MTSERDVLVLDASVLINILATGFAQQILAALPEKCLIAEQVANEVHRDPRDRNSLDPLSPYIQNSLLAIAKIEGQAIETFISLVDGPLEESLDDGEAATLAIAYHGGHVAAIDENKARNLSKRRFPELRHLRTVEILQRDFLTAILGDGRYVRAISDALEHGRMQVPPEHQAWVRNMVGDDTFGRFPSLTRKSPNSSRVKKVSG